MALKIPLRKRGKLMSALEDSVLQSSLRGISHSVLASEVGVGRGMFLP